MATKRGKSKQKSVITLDGDKSDSDKDPDWTPRLERELAMRKNESSDVEEEEESDDGESGSEDESDSEASDTSVKRRAAKKRRSSPQLAKKKKTKIPPKTTKRKILVKKRSQKGRKNPTPSPPPSTESNKEKRSNKTDLTEERDEPKSVTSPQPEPDDKTSNSVEKPTSEYVLKMPDITNESKKPVITEYDALDRQSCGGGAYYTGHCYGGRFQVVLGTLLGERGYQNRRPTIKCTFWDYGDNITPEALSHYFKGRSVPDDYTRGKALTPKMTHAIWIFDINGLKAMRTAEPRIKTALQQARLKAAVTGNYDLVKYSMETLVDGDDGQRLSWRAETENGKSYLRVGASYDFDGRSELWPKTSHRIEERLCTLFFGKILPRLQQEAEFLQGHQTLNRSFSRSDSQKSERSEEEALNFVVEAFAAVVAERNKKTSEYDLSVAVEAETAVSALMQKGNTKDVTTAVFAAFHSRALEQMGAVKNLELRVIYNIYHRILNDVNAGHARVVKAVELL